MKKKILAGITGLVMSAAALTAPIQPTKPLTADAAEVNVNYGEALQKSMFFYEVQQAGVLPEWNMVSWRGNSMENDYVPGGWFDAGDHFKFALTNAYTAAVLAWGMVEYKDALKEAGLYDLYLQNLQWGLDYVAGCDMGDKVIGTIGADGFDHTWWGSAELYQRKLLLQSGTDVRPYDEITCTSTMAQMAAAMAAGSIVFKDEDPELAKSYLEHAESLFKNADTIRSNEDQGMQKSYYSASDYFDDLFYAANWLYMATGEQSYLDKCESDYIPNYPLENQSSDRKFTWGFCWDDSSQAAALLYAINTGKQEWIDQVTAHLEYWTTGYHGKQVDYTPDGLAWLFNWGSLRHATTTAFLAKVAVDELYQDDAAKTEKYDTWAKEQLDYAFGDNDLGLCYVQGMGEKNPVTFHHRTASGIHDDHWQSLGLDPAEAEGWQTEFAHTLYGALEGGPDKDGGFTDEVGNYQFSEVAIDYNAGYTGLLCAMIADYGGEPLADFPPTETPKWNEFEVSAVIQQNAPNYTQIQLWAMNHTAWPSRVVKDLSYNYYFDISELKAAGLSIDDVTVSIGYDQHAGDEGALSLSGPFQYDGDVYYVKMSFGDGSVVMPTGQSEHRAEAQIRIAIPDAIDGQSTAGIWDPTNDYSFQGLTEGGQEALKTPEAVTTHITMYDGDTLIFGEEPDGTTPEIPEPTGRPTEPPTEPSETEEDSTGEPVTSNNAGDVNVDDEVDILDVIALNKFLLGANQLDPGQKSNADVMADGTLDSTDSLTLLKYVVKIIDTLPVKP